jgi:hypothetical protein
MGKEPMHQSHHPSDPPDLADLSDLAEQARLLRAALERVRNELAVAAAAEEALVLKLKELGVSVEGIGAPGGGTTTASGLGDTLSGAFGLGTSPGEETTKTQIDTFGIAGLPKSRRGRSLGGGGGMSSSQQGMLKAAAAGAGLMLGLALFVLLVINLASSKRDPASSAMTNANAATTSSGSGPTTPPRPLDDSRQIPPPPPAPNSEPPTPPAVASAAPAIVSAVVPAPATKPGAATNLPEGTSTLTVVCTPRCDSVTSDNNPLGGSPTNVPIAPGTHKLTLSAPNGVKKTLMVNINQGQAREVRLSMEPGTPHDYGF